MAIGQTVRLVLVGDRYYSGEIIEEDDRFILLRDKFNKLVTVGKSSLISMEVMNK